MKHDLDHQEKEKEYEQKPDKSLRVGDVDVREDAGEPRGQFVCEKEPYDNGCQGGNTPDKTVVDTEAEEEGNDKDGKDI